LDGGLEVGKIHHHAALRVHGPVADDLQAIAVAMGAPTLSRVSGEVVGGLEFEAAGDDHGKSLALIWWDSEPFEKEAAHGGGQPLWSVAGPRREVLRG
jgi:hypothetical protein